MACDARAHLLSLSIEDLNRMKLEFNEAFEEIFTKSIKPLEMALKLKIRAIRHCAEVLEEAMQDPKFCKMLEKELGVGEDNSQDDISENLEELPEIVYNLKSYNLKMLSSKKSRREIMEENEDFCGLSS